MHVFRKPEDLRNALQFSLLPLKMFHKGHPWVIPAHLKKNPLTLSPAGVICHNHLGGDV